MAGAVVSSQIPNLNQIDEIEEFNEEIVLTLPIQEKENINQSRPSLATKRKNDQLVSKIPKVSKKTKRITAIIEGRRQKTPLKETVSKLEMNYPEETLDQVKPTTNSAPQSATKKQDHIISFSSDEDDAQIPLKQSGLPMKLPPPPQRQPPQEQQQLEQLEQLEQQQQSTGNESLVEKFILSKLNKTVKETNEAIAEMNFMQATNLVYSFILHDFCDVYIEAAKSLIDSDDKTRKESAKNTLFTCLDQGLKLLHPMMPFLTEELYQRIPRRQGDTCPSICIAQYPLDNTTWHFPAEEASFEVVLTAVTGLRVLLFDNTVKSNAHGMRHIHVG